MQPFGEGGDFFEGEGGWRGTFVFPAVDGGKGDTEFGGKFFLGESKFVAERANQVANFGLLSVVHHVHLCRTYHSPYAKPYREMGTQ